ncbi:hypothetical protein GWI33_022948 [Rhynchophorus ferrugineus]|uniref:Uncharacterized protein n=1 Tax=Rhynchophorus ferrugineus TaxID=354439 RepID=A0A834HRP7_RHYFE|nr:hypothetical protein GWI33_022948 [Rhynchophorus ferrugineus]
MNKHEIERERDDRYQPASDRPDVTARVSGSEVDDDGHGGVWRGGSGGASPSPLSVDRDDDDDDDDGTETYGAKIIRQLKRNPHLDRGWRGGEDEADERAGGGGEGGRGSSSP